MHREPVIIFIVKWWSVVVFSSNLATYNPYCFEILVKHEKANVQLRAHIVSYFLTYVRMDD